jgi:hypothetical protein
MIAGLKLELWRVCKPTVVTPLGITVTERMAQQQSEVNILDV